jgi:hypothetical protein
MSVPVYKLSRFVGPELGGCGGQFGEIRAFLKPNCARAPYGVANEYICNRLGLFLGLPVPPGGVVRARGGEPWYASLDFNLANATLSAVDLTRCARELPRLFAGVLLFDIVVMNNDRDPENLAVDFESEPPRMSVFDFSHALFGADAGRDTGHLAEYRDRLGVVGPPHRHDFLDVVTSDAHFQEWFERIEAIPDYLIVDVVDHARDFGVTEREAAAAADCLKHRRTNLRAIVGSHRSEFTSITSWQA